MTENRKTDYLREDPEINGQRYTVVSIVNPQDRVLMKNLYYVNKFLVRDINQQIVAQSTHMAKKLQVDMRKKIDSVLDRLKMSTDEEDKHLYTILHDKFANMLIDEDEFVQECHRKYTLDEEEILDKYKIFISSNRVQTDNEFDDAHGDDTSVRGIKIRGAYGSYKEAAARCEYVRSNIEEAISAYVVSVGTWFPIDFEADEIQDQDYMLPALNDLMGKYHEGMRNKDAHYQERKKNMADSQTNDPASKLQKRLQQRKRDRIKKEIQEFKQVQEGTNEPESKEVTAAKAIKADKNAAELINGEEKQKEKQKKRKRRKNTKKDDTEELILKDQE
uniref:Uncharacterized protein n=1 Tax=viral metagenome TaxID=1070528 RepID=A0A6C0J4U1_9ZZZZ